MSPYQFLSRSKLSQHIKPPVRPVVQPSAQIEGENGLGWATSLLDLLSQYIFEIYFNLYIYFLHLRHFFLYLKLLILKIIPRRNIICKQFHRL